MRGCPAAPWVFSGALCAFTRGKAVQPPPPVPACLSHLLPPFPNRPQLRERSRHLCPPSRGRPCASSCLQCGWLTEEGPARFQPAAVTFPTARLRAFVREREKRRALLYRKHNLAQVH